MGFTKEDSNVQAAAGTKKITSFFGGKAKAKAPPADKENDENGGETKAVSYTHLTLPTIYSV